MKAKFCTIEPDSVDYLPQDALLYLESGLKSSPTSDLTLKDVIAYAKNGIGEIILVSFDAKFSGAAFFMYGEGYNGKILDVVTLGADSFTDWKAEFLDFMKETARKHDCNEIMSITRPGWGRVYPELEAIGVVYRLGVG